MNRKCFPRRKFKSNTRETPRAIFLLFQLLDIEVLKRSYVCYIKRKYKTKTNPKMCVLCVPTLYFTSAICRRIKIKQRTVCV